MGAMLEHRQRHACAACSTSALLLFFFAHGEFAELISANSAASPAVLGVGVHIHEAPVSPAGASCRSAPGRLKAVRPTPPGRLSVTLQVPGGGHFQGRWCQAVGV